jgi:hypothetical protein
VQPAVRINLPQQDETAVQSCHRTSSKSQKGYSEITGSLPPSRHTVIGRNGSFRFPGTDGHTPPADRISLDAGAFKGTIA